VSQTATAPEVTVRYWAGARRAAGRSSEKLRAASVADLRAQLGARPELSEILAASSLLVDGVAGRPESRLTEGATVDVLPPFAGG
jgi:molybdopterin synthase sulfur carrier subunit